jgi:hypothetical protein
MYAPPPVGVAGGSPRTGLLASAPVLAICCLLFILFVIASVIILALIPVYVAKSNTINVPTYTYVIGSNNTIVQSKGNIANIIARALGISSNLVTIKSVSSAGKRKRRGFGLSRSRRFSVTNSVTGSCEVASTSFASSVSSAANCYYVVFSGYYLGFGPGATLTNLLNSCSSTTTTSTVNTG